MSQLFYGKCIDLKFVPSNQSAWLTYLENNDKKSVWLEIDEDRPKRTLNANAYLWGVVYENISKHTGHTSEELHEIYSRMFLKPKFITYKDKEIKLPTGTSDLNKLEFMEFTDRVIAEGAGMGIVIPPPNTKNKEFDIQSVHEGIEKPTGEIPW